MGYRFQQLVSFSTELVLRDMFVFIVGRGRSGTTLLKSMLDRHPDISIAPESLFVVNTHSKYGRLAFEDDVAWKFYNDIWLEGRLQNWHLDREKLKESLLKDVEIASFSEQCRKVYLEYARQNGKIGVTIIGDKNPHHALFLQELHDIFPDARFVHIVRDFRDNVLSYQSVGFDMRNTAALAYRWVIYNRNILKFISKRPGRAIQLRFEDLVLDPVNQLKNICDFLAVEYTDEMLEVDGNDNIHAQDWHKNVSRPPDKNLIYQWKARMSKVDLAISERIAGQMGERFGYASTHSEGKLSISARLWCASAWLYTLSEKLLFLLPLKFRSSVIRYYRKKTRPGTI